MKYLLALIGDESPMADRTPEQMAEAMRAWDAYTNELRDAGAFLGGEGLQPSSTATTVKLEQTGAPVVTDGPFPESKELLAGYRMIDVESEERAIEIAAKASAAPGPGGIPIQQPIEVRQVMGAPSSDL